MPLFHSPGIFHLFMLLPFIAMERNMKKAKREKTPVNCVPKLEIPFKWKSN